MSTPAKTRKTAFARKPRGDTSTADKPKKVTINRDFLSKLKDPRLDETLNDVLTSTSGVLTLEFRAQGGASITIVDKESKTIADNNDVMRILSMNSTITKEKSKAIKESSKSSIVRVLWSLKEHVNGIPDKSVPEDLPAGMRDIVQKMQVVLQNLKANIDQIADKGDLAGSDLHIKDYLTVMNIRIRNAIVNYMVGKLTNYDEADSLNVELFKKKVPIWVYSKLTGQKMNLSQKGFEFRYTLFPKDPSKGLCLSFAEIRDLEFLRAQGKSILSAAYFAHTFMRDNAFISAFCNVEDVTSEETKKLLANVPIMIPEPYVATKDLVDTLAEQGIRQYSWPVGYAVSPKDNLQFLGTLFKRAAVVAITRPQFQALLIEQLFSGFTFDAGKRDANVFQQLKSSFKEGTNFQATVLSGSVRTFNDKVDARLAVKKLLVSILDISPEDYTRLGIIERILTINADGELREGETALAIPPPAGFVLESDLWGPISIGANSVDVKNKDVAAFDEASRQRTQKKAEKKVSLIRQTVANRSLLTTDAQLVLGLLRTLKYKALIDPISLFFRGFLTAPVQAAVARLMYARIAGILAKPSKLHGKDLADMLDLDAVVALGDTLGEGFRGEDDDDGSDYETDNSEDLPPGEVPS